MRISDWSSDVCSSDLGKQGFRFPLASDADSRLCDAFGVIQPKKLYGREFVGIERSTFLIDPAGVVRAAWRKVKVPGHARSEERRVGKESVRTCRSRWAPHHQKQKPKNISTITT